MSSERRRCCSAGCVNTTDEANWEELARLGWVKLSYGFMLWACPEHGQALRQIDLAILAYEAEKGRAYQVALEAFEAKFEAEWGPRRPLMCPIQPTRCPT